MKKKDTARMHVWIEGRVQGVFFRGSTRSMARSLGLTGYVRNLPDGRVEAVFEGPAETVRQAIKWCEEGPPAARVKSVRTEREEPAGEYDSFSILIS